MEYTEKIKKLEEKGITTKLLPSGQCIFSLKEANEKLLASEVIELVERVYYYFRNSGDTILRDLGLEGYWAVLKR
jgi:hypothetical protein